MAAPTLAVCSTVFLVLSAVLSSLGCDEGYEILDRNCEDVNECMTNNGGCDQICTNTQGSFQCSCRSGYRLRNNGRRCADINECAEGSHTCGQHQCRNRPAGSFQCNCDSGYRQTDDGKRCEEINECTEGSHTCGQHQCRNRPAGSYQCNCDTGYNQTDDGKRCEDVNECNNNNGGCAQMCVNSQGSFRCSCRSGFLASGRSCIDVNECNTTNNGGCTQLCNNTQGSFQCNCTSGYRLLSDGRSCTEVNECNANNGGCAQMCNNTQGSFQCSCRDGYRLLSDSKNCTDINECQVENGGCSQNCTNTEGSYHCLCEAEYRIATDNHTCIGPPQSLTITVGLTTLFISWNPPSPDYLSNENDSILQHYEVSCYDDENTTTLMETNTTALNISLTDLEINNNYTCCILIYTSIGEGPSVCESEILIQTTGGSSAEDSSSLIAGIAGSIGTVAFFILLAILGILAVLIMRKHQPKPKKSAESDPYPLDNPLYESGSGETPAVATSDTKLHLPEYAVPKVSSKANPIIKLDPHPLDNPLYDSGSGETPAAATSDTKLQLPEYAVPKVSSKANPIKLDPHPLDNPLYDSGSGGKPLPAANGGKLFDNPLYDTCETAENDTIKEHANPQNTSKKEERSHEAAGYEVPVSSTPGLDEPQDVTLQLFDNPEYAMPALSGQEAKNDEPKYDEPIIVTRDKPDTGTVSTARPVNDTGYSPLCHDYSPRPPEHAGAVPVGPEEYSHLQS